MADRGIGVLGMEVYFPTTFVEQADLEKYDGVSEGKYTIGLGQQRMAFASDREDINSVCMTAVQSLMEKYEIPYEKIGRLEVCRGFVAGCSPAPRPLNPPSPTFVFSVASPCCSLRLY